MLRRTPRRSNNERNGNHDWSDTDGSQLPLRRIKKSPQPRPSRSCTPTLKRIVVVELTFLVLAWVLFSDRLLSSWRLRKGTTNLRVFTRNSRAEQLHANVKQDREQMLNSQLLEARAYKGPTLVIGGSDGSGTRAFASIMKELGVPMWLEDKQTLDAHGSAMFEMKGWPPLATLVLNATHSASYEVKQLSNETQTIALEELAKLKQKAALFAVRQRRRAEILSETYMSKPKAAGVAMGFKAPVTMLLVPLLKEAFGPIKFLHIVRDGRDVAVGSNKSPVEKFYKFMYPDADARMVNHPNISDPVLAMHLWNDWNTQLLEWEKVHASDQDFDFLVMRSEDLLNPEKKFESLVRMAKLVGSSVTMEKLCCMSRESVVDMGQSVQFDEEASRLNRFRKHGNLGSLRGTNYTAYLEQLRATIEEQRNTTERQQGQSGRHMHAFKQRVRAEIENRLKRIGNNESVAGEIAPKVIERYERWASIMKDKPDVGSDVHKDLPKVNERYGKWVRILKDKPDVAAELNQEGEKGLATFGYAPLGERIMEDFPSTDHFQCDDSILCDV